MRWPQFLTLPRPPDFTVRQGDSDYMRRWWVIPRNMRFNIYLHHIVRSDDDRAMHDHPWWNVSILLWGKYLEVMPGTTRRIRRPFIPVFRQAEAAHRLELVDDEPVWSLFITGPVVRQWGFHCPRGWVFWKDFVSVANDGRSNDIGRGCDE